jgi:hypothetical protein
VELPATPNNLLLKPPSRAKAREESARKALRSPSALRMRTPAGRNREELENEALKSHLTGSASIENMAVSKPGHPTRFVRGLLDVLVSADRTL